MDASQVERGQHWLEELLRLAGFPLKVAGSPTSPISSDSGWLAIEDTGLTPEQIQLLLGSDAAVLDSVQYLCNATLNLGQAPDYQGAFTIDLAGHRLRRYEELKQLAEQAAEQVRQTGEEYALKSLSSAERRQVHTLLKDYTDLETYSRGQEPNRHLVVRPSPQS